MICRRCQGASTSGVPAFAPVVWRKCVSKNSSTRVAGFVAVNGGRAAATGWGLGPALIGGVYSKSPALAGLQANASKEHHHSSLPSTLTACRLLRVVAMTEPAQILKPVILWTTACGDVGRIGRR